MGRKRKDTTKRKSNIINNNLQVPRVVGAGTAYIELSGNKEAMIEGCKGVIEYTDDEIKLNIGKNEIRFLGADLVIKSYFSEQIIIEGNILTIEYS